MGQNYIVNYSATLIGDSGQFKFETLPGLQVCRNLDWTMLERLRQTIKLQHCYIAFVNQ